MVLQRLTPIVRGWAAYYRTVVSSEAFAALDSYLWRLTYKWAKLSHPKKPKHWIVNRYFGRFNKSRQDRWVFGDRDSGAYLVKHRLDQDRPTPDGQGRASPDDPALAEYWAGRRRRAAPPPLDNLSLRLLQAQQGDARCAGNCSSTPTTRRKAPRVGAVGALHGKAISQTVDLPASGARRTTSSTSSHPHPMPTSPVLEPARPANCNASSLWACLSRMRGNGAVRF